MERVALVTMFLAVGSVMGLTQMASGEHSKPFVVEYYYKAKWGIAARRSLTPYPPHRYTTTGRRREGFTSFFAVHPATSRDPESARPPASSAGRFHPAVA
jgi:hypothetical protein